ncbi:methylenetetrahydrofolate reductase [NAD(P)H] [Coprococcus sp. BIOML-A1]|uniref:methylenetetrahydrofolate reductase [NAD(P)H] n=1 Tax=unclassified Coprococcus TaxID=2684943 RepID=UPI00136D97A5|nr:MULTISPECIES: methylenetetrahydrofolate reductase [NAD(P)H] [unclassified Coprococcus]MZK39518.1 methylenetetrahydrofolate reductase [NAD(P)H] [Coprococcus sp. BIOML-A1]MZK64362.1 methylenetetrahydrofolate reductase [NAD(P)H] [Coprococcus sp. BIOML-A2]
MKIRDLITQDKATLSFEVFPPKKDTDFADVEAAALGIAAFKPDYMSVTYGAGGSTKGHTIQLAREIQEKYDVPTIAHLTCVCASKEGIKTALADMKNAGIENILALRGDIPKNYDGQVFAEFSHASELVELIKETGDFCVGGACYPEVHPDSANKHEDIIGLKKKVDAGCDYLTTQMFFDNNIFFNFMYRIREVGISVPIIPGIMPITRRVQVKNAVKLSGCNVPERFKSIVDAFGDTEAAMRQAGIAYATDQIIDLMANGVKHIHVYSMNKPEVAAGIQKNLSEILKI